MTSFIAALIGIRAGAEAALEALGVGFAEIECKHEQTETLPGSTMGNVQVRCTKCGKEWRE